MSKLFCNFAAAFENTYEKNKDDSCRIGMFLALRLYDAAERMCGI